MNRRARRALVAAVGVLSLVAAALASPFEAPSRHLTVTFERTIGLYEGADVRVLGIDVGRVEDVRVEGSSVRVTISYDPEVDLPRDVEALVVAPAVVGDRFVQLAPAYVGGATLPDGAHVDMARTAIPVELDDTYRTVRELAVALGPRGANVDGALSRVIGSAAELLSGNGRRLNRTVGQLAGAMSVLAAGTGDMSSMIRNLARVTDTLVGNDDRLRRVVTLLASVGVEIAGQRTEIVGAVDALGTALEKVRAFTRSHRSELTSTVQKTSRVASRLARHTETLNGLVDLFPVGLTNLVRLYVPTNWDPNNPAESVVDGRTGSGALRDNIIDSLDTQLGYLLLAICDQLSPADRLELDAFCTTLGNLGGSLGALLQQITQRGALGARGGTG